MIKPSRSIIFITGVLLIARVVASILAPSEETGQIGSNFILNDIVPSNFNGWVIDPSVRVIQPNEEGDLKSRVYDQTLSRGYRDEGGNLVMVVIAYGHNQSDALQLHRPEVCYVANGFKIISNKRYDVKLTSYSGISIPSLRLVALSSNRPEIVTYWTRVGDKLPTSNLRRQYEKLKYGLSGKIPDGVLVRVSTISDKPEEAYELQDKFINDLIDIIDKENLEFFLGPLIETGKKNSKVINENTPD